jgi:predicted nucleotidyltransferase
MSASKRDLSDRLELGNLARVVAAIRACSDARFLLVGAAARDLVLHHHHGITLHRATRDIDLAVSLPDWESFDDLRLALIRSGFAADDRMRHRLEHGELGTIDLVPFGAIETEHGSLEWPPDGDPVMNVLGFSEASECAHEYRLPGGAEVHVVSPASMALLKVLAWEDRGRQVQRKDASDLFFLLRSYEEADNEQRIFDEARSVLGTYDLEELGAWLLGHDAVNEIRSNPHSRPSVLESVLAIVIRECDPGGPLRLVGDAEGADINRRIALLGAFRAGLEHDS